MGRPKGGHNKPMSSEHREKLTIINQTKANDPEFRKTLIEAGKRRRGIPSPIKGRKRTPFTEEHKRNISLAKKGKQLGKDNPFFGKHHTDEVKQLNREKHTGTIISETTRKRMSIFQKKRFEDPLEREKMGKKTKGRKLPKEQADRLAEINRKKAKDPKFLETLSKSLKGKKKSDAYRENIRGEKNHQWKGGLRPLSKAIRDSIKYSEWRLAVYKRDNFCDWFSGLPGHGNLTAHHRNPFNNILRSNNIITFEQAMACESLWDINNGVTMFKTSHEAYHQMWGNDTHPNGRRTKNEPSRFDNT